MATESVQEKTGTVVNRAEGAVFDAGLRAFFAYRDLGVRAATGGGFGAHVIRAVAGEGPRPRWHLHELDFQLVLVLRGSVTFEYEDIGTVTLRPGDSVMQPPRIRHREVAHSDDLELLEVTAPAEFATREVEPPARST
jgi:quercetin dioxygenase-like cupin family protein